MPIAAATGIVFIRKNMQAVIPNRTGLVSAGRPAMFA